MDKEKRVYVHYGNSEFRPELLYGPHNQRYRNKPAHALWASPKDAKLSWKEWCENEDFNTDRLIEYFEFTLKDSAKIFVVDSVEKERTLPIQDDGFDGLDNFFRNYDFDKIKADGYDAVECCLSDCWRLYDEMCTWDCDSIAILNPDVVEPICGVYKIPEKTENKLKYNFKTLAETDTHALNLLIQQTDLLEATPDLRTPENLKKYFNMVTSSARAVADDISRFEQYIIKGDKQ